MNRDRRSRMRALAARVAELFRRDRIRAELDEELRLHLDLETEHNVRQGMSLDDAGRAAIIALGGMQRTREQAHEARGFFALDALVRDTRYAWRSLRLAPVFSVMAIATIALGIAAATSVFGFANAIFLRPLVHDQGDRVVRVFVQQPDGSDGVFGHDAARLIERRAKSLDLVGEHYSTAPLYVTADAWQAEIPGAVVSADYFRVAGVRPRIGRFFTRGEDSVPDRDAVAVIGENLWRTKFGFDTTILHKSIRINGRSFSIIGVAPSTFAGVEPERVVDQLWIPTAMFRAGYRWCDPLAQQPPCAVSAVLARLAPGATLDGARAEMSAMRASLLALSEPRDSLKPVIVERAVGFSPGSRAEYRHLAQLLWAISSILLVIACTNLASLLLVRGLTRRREIAVRLAIGASRAHVTRQLVIENVLLGTIGGAVGMPLSMWGTLVIASFFTVDNEGYRPALNTQLDLRVLAFAIATGLLASVIFGIFPAITATRTDLVASLKAGDRGSDGRSRARHILVGAQVMLAVVLLVGAALLTRSVGNVLSRQRFDASHVALMRLRPRLVGYSPDKAQRYLANVTRVLSSVPGVERVGLARGIGFVWNSNTTAAVELPGALSAKPGTVPADASRAIMTTVSPNFFAALGVTLEQGRDFNDRDRAETPPVAIVNRALAARLWPDASPIGHTVLIDEKAFTVVGVVANYRVRVGLESDRPMAFAAFWQNAFGPEIDARVAVRVRGDPAAMLASLADAAREVGATVPITELLPMSAQVSATFSEIRLARSVLIGAGSLALFLCAVGLYGVVAFIVATRGREVGIRMALGAQRFSIIALYMTQNLRWAVIGIALGTLEAFVGARLVSGWLVGVTSNDPASFAIAIAAAVAACVLGTLVPSWNAARVDPTTALRTD